MRAYTSGELFAGAGGFALGMEKAGFVPVFLNELNKHACATLRSNRPNWNILEGDVSKIDFSSYAHELDVLCGGFPCQAFSCAGKKLGFKDCRGTLFFELARVAKQLQPKLILVENVKALLSHDQGETLRTISSVFGEIGYRLIEPALLNAVNYFVPQKRERVFLVAVREDLPRSTRFIWPIPCVKTLTVRDALKKGILYDSDVPESQGFSYSPRKAKILAHVPPGGCWRHLPERLQKEYLGKSFFSGGGKTGTAKRLSWDEPCPTLTCSPAQKQTERCHPDDTRPLTIREYARIQTFPDSWHFSGSITEQYKQIGNAVPVTLAHAVGLSALLFLNGIEAEEE